MAAGAGASLARCRGLRSSAPVTLVWRRAAESPRAAEWRRLDLMTEPAHVHGYRWCRPKAVPTRLGSRWGGRMVVDVMTDLDRYQRPPASSESMPIADGVDAVACSAHSCKSTRSMEFLHARSMTIELRGDHPSEITRTPVDWEGLSRPPSGHRCWGGKRAPPRDGCLLVTTTGRAPSARRPLPLGAGLIDHRPALAQARPNDDPPQ